LIGRKILIGFGCEDLESIVEAPGAEEDANKF
jgi:hypothetical protein